MRSRWSRSAGGLLAAACLMAASACGADSSEQLVTPPAPDSADSADEPSATWAPTAGAIEPVRTVASTPVTVSAPFDGMVDESEFVPVQWLVPWDDGFLAVGVRYPPQPLPDQLPPEIAALFPPEILALFPDGLPPTLDEATETLREAGLFDEVMAILNEHPDAMDAVQSAPQPDPELLASWSTDGDAWVAVDVVWPDGMGDITQLAVSGDRLTLAGSVTPEDAGGSWLVTVASTTDLENWITERFPVTQAEGVAEEERIWITPIAVAANDEHWVVRIMVDVVGGPISDEPPAAPSAELWSGAWAGEPAKRESDRLSWMLLATSDGFLDFGQGVTFSPDGMTWTAAPEQGPNVNFQAASPLGDDVLAIASTPAGEASSGESSIVVLDATGTPIGEVGIAEVGESFWSTGPMSSPAMIVAATMPGPPEVTIVVEHDGYELTQQYGDVASYQLVELSAGEVVVEESVDLRTTEMGDDGPFEYLTEDEDGITITDPESSVTIVEIPRSVLASAWDEAQGGDEATEAGQPDLWLLATADGETWLVHDLDDGGPDAANAPTLVATNGTTVLTGTFAWEPNGIEAWQRFTITE